MILFVLFSFDVLINELLYLPEAAEHDRYLDFYDKKQDYFRYDASVEDVSTSVLKN